LETNKKDKVNSKGKEKEKDKEKEAFRASNEPLYSDSIKEGWLYKRTSGKNMIAKWNKRWFVLRNDKLSYSSKKELPKQVQEFKFPSRRKVRELEVMFLSAKPAYLESMDPREQSKNCFFDIPTRNQTFHLCAPTPEQKVQWIAAINATRDKLVELELARMDIEDEQERQGINGNNFSNDDDQNKVSLSESRRLLDEILKIPGNDKCADCGAEHPSWAVINIGIFICLNCSGVHRGLGIDISQVRSTTLDRWKLEDINYMKSMGNTKFTQIWDKLNKNQDNQAELLPPSSSNTGNCASEEWIRYITAKYTRYSTLKDEEGARPKGTLRRGHPSPLLG
jgi:hypothetical protein